MRTTKDENYDEGDNLNLKLALTALKNPLNRRMEIDEILKKIREAIRLLEEVVDAE